MAQSLLNPRALEACELCPRRCGARRAAGESGVCGASDTLKVARAALHFWEEPPVSGERGSGTIFFSHCPLKCVFCQNREISTDGFGLEVPVARLTEMMLELQDQGANNINLVTATHYAHLLPRAVAEARERGLTVPIVYNTSGYERADVVRELGDIVDVWLTDYKYASSVLAQRLSAVPDYPEVASEALKAMVSAVEKRGGVLYADDDVRAETQGSGRGARRVSGQPEAGCLLRGAIVRVLVLPGEVEDACRVLDRIWDAVGDVPISVMNQYTPNAAMRAAGGELARAITSEEYEAVLDHADDLGFNTMYWQEGGTVDESFTPPFDTTGVLAPAGNA